MTSASGKEFSDTGEMNILLLRPGDSTVDAPVSEVIAAGNPEIEAGENMELCIGNADGAPLWAFADLFGENGRRLGGQAVALDGLRSGTGSLSRLSFEYRAEYPDAVRLQVFFFRGGKMTSFSQEYRRKTISRDLPVEWTSFEDRTGPASVTRVSLRTSPRTEVLTSISLFTVILPDCGS